MKLEKYLADYLLNEEQHQNVPVFSEEWFEQFIKQGLDAFESTENVQIEIKPIPEQCLDCPDRGSCDGWDEK